MHRSLHWSFFLICILSSAVLNARNEPDDVAMLMHLDKQQPQALSFFVRNAPLEVVTSPDKPVKFGPLPNGVTAHLTNVGHLAGCQLFAIRYLTDTRLENGNDGAIGLLLLCSVKNAPNQYAPLYVAWGADEGLVDDYSVSEVRHFKEFSFIWLRTDTSGTADTILRTAITAPDAQTPLHEYEMFADIDPLTKLEKQGWEYWHRGNYFVEDSLTWHYHIYKDPSKDKKYTGPPQRLVRVRYTFRKGKLYPGKIEEDEE
jgi:hypothetical protein